MSLWLNVPTSHFRQLDKESEKSGNSDVPSDSEEEDEWIRENILKKETLLETRSRKTHLVHCPYYPSEKYEWWWLFLLQKKLKRIVVPGTHCTTLVDEETVKINFIILFINTALLLNISCWGLEAYSGKFCVNTLFAVVEIVHLQILFSCFQVEIKFGAPQEKGVYYYTLLVKSDSYMDCDYSLDLKVSNWFLELFVL